MQLLLLGANFRTTSLLDTLQHIGESIQVTGWFDSDELGDQLAERYPQGNRIQAAEDFAKTVGSETVVLVGQGGDLTVKERLLRELARDGIPLILEQPACSAIFAVELDMIQRDTEAPMIPFHPPSYHPVFARLAQWTRGSDSPIGTIEQVVMERSLPERSDATVRSELARDGLLLRRLLGNFHRVGAMPAKEIKSLSNMSVHLTGESNAVGRWSVSPINDAPGATLTLIGAAGRLTLNMPDDAAWILSSTVDALPAETLPPLDMKSLAKDVIAGLQGQPIHPTWEDAFRASDLADTACESVRRGKTLPISNERLTEEDTFKSLMAAGGCLIILVIPLLLLLVSLFDGLDIPRQRTALCEVTRGQRTIPLPGDFEAIEHLKLDATNLPALSQRQLFAEHGTTTMGRPAAYHLSRNDITFAPAADGTYQLELAYEGSFRIWSGWPILLLTPIALFLVLQLLKLAFPKKEAAE